MGQEKLTRDELVELVRKIMTCEGSEKEIDEMIFFIEGKCFRSTSYRLYLL